MLHDPEPRHLQLGLELGERLAISLMQQTVQKEAAGGIRQCLENRVVGHTMKYVTI